MPVRMCECRALLCVSLHVPHGHNIIYTMYMQKSAWIALPCIACWIGTATNKRAPCRVCCWTDTGNNKRCRKRTGVGEQDLQRQSIPVQPAPVCKELYRPRRMSLQHRGTCSDPALSAIVVPQAAAGGWLEQQGDEYYLASSMLTSSLQYSTGTCFRAVRLLLIPWIIPYPIGCWDNIRSEIMTIDTYCGSQSVGLGVYR